jgi:hypothetical protein
VTASNLDDKESTVTPSPRGRTARGLTIAVLVSALAVVLIGLLVVGTGYGVSTDAGHAPGTGSTASTASSAGTGSSASTGPAVSTGMAAGAPDDRLASAGTTLAPRTTLGPVPTRLDAEFAAYSDRSTCADWAGGDGLAAVRLSASQIAWFFSDSFFGPAGPTTGFADSSGIAHNTMVIQTLNGQGSTFVTLTGGGVCTPKRYPAAVVGPPQAPGKWNTRYWGEDGIKVGQTIFKFYNGYPPGNAPYVPTGTVLAAFQAGQLSAAGNGSASGGSAIGRVATPRLTPLPSYTPPGAISPIAWGAAVLRTGGTVYVYGTQTPDTPVPDRQVYVARAPVSKLTQFTAWQFYAGSGRWSASQPAAQPLQPQDSSLSVSSGFSVVQVGARYWLIQANPIAGTQDIDAYPADAPWGPFDQAAGIVLYRDPGIGIDAAHDYRILYEARVVPVSPASNALVVGYNVNSIASSAGCVPMSWFTNTVLLPRFISVPLAVLSQPGGGRQGDGQQDVVSTGPSDYPRIASRDPAQWFNEWNYPDGCPPVPGVTSVRAQPRSGAVTLSWPDAGLGVGYRVSLQRAGATGIVASTSVSFDLSSPARPLTVTFSRLRPGRYVAQVVPINLMQHTGHVGQVAFTVPGA